MALLIPTNAVRLLASRMVSSVNNLDLHLQTLSLATPLALAV
jgi:hypothetical protein